MSQHAILGAAFRIVVLRDQSVTTASLD